MGKTTIDKRGLKDRVSGSYGERREGTEAGVNKSQTVPTPEWLVHMCTDSMVVTSMERRSGQKFPDWLSCTLQREYFNRSQKKKCYLSLGSCSTTISIDFSLWSLSDM